MAKITCLAERVIVINDPIYIITLRSGSATNSSLYYSEQARNGFLKAANDLFQFQLNICKTKEQKVFMNQPIIQFTIVYLISHKGIEYFKHYSDLNTALKKGSLKLLQTEGCSDFYKKNG